jgi:glycosyltransferase involved in cell wall biosynthesis
MAKIKTIAINGSMLDNQPTGVGVYTYNIINNLSNLLKNHATYKLLVYTPTISNLEPGVELRKVTSLMQSSKYGRFAAIIRFIWNTLYYPILSRHAALRISTTTHGSITSSNQLLTIHDLLSLKYGNISKHQRFYFRYLLPTLIKKSNLIIAVSETTKKDIIELVGCPPEKIKVIYNGYDKQRYHPAKNSSNLIQRRYKVNNYFLAIGPTYPHKNFENLLSAYKKLSTDIKKTHPLVIAGGLNPYLQTIKSFAKKEGLENDVYFLGYVPAELMPALYQEARALLFPSIYEGFGIPLVEAMACGCPIATSDTSSMPEVCGDAALYFNPHSTNSILSTLTELVRTDTDRKTLIQKGLARAELFTWEKSATQFKSLIDQQLN